MNETMSIDLRRERNRLVTYLCFTVEEELEWINTIGQCISDHGHPVENEWWFMWAFKQGLLQNVDDDCGRQKEKHCDKDFDE